MKIFSYAVFFLLLLTSLNLRAGDIDLPIEGGGQGNTLYFSEWGSGFCRPSDRWRVLESSSSLRELRYMRRGGNVSLFIKESLVRQIVAKKQRRRIFKDRILADFLAPYEAEGFQFYQHERTESGIHARGTNAEREILFLEGIPVKNGRIDGTLILEMRIPREDYQEFNPAFEAVRRSFSDSGASHCLNRESKASAKT